MSEKPQFIMPEILMPASVSAHSDFEAAQLLSASDTGSEIKLGILRQLLFRHQVKEFSLNACALAYSNVDLRLRSAVLASICSAIDRWGIESSVVDSCERAGLLFAIQEEPAVILWPWCLLARAALSDERLDSDLSCLKHAMQEGGLTNLMSVYQGQTSRSERTDLALCKVITAAIYRIENQKRLLAFCY